MGSFEDSPPCRCYYITDSSLTPPAFDACHFCYYFLIFSLIKSPFLFVKKTSAHGGFPADAPAEPCVPAAVGAAAPPAPPLSPARGDRGRSTAGAGGRLPAGHATDGGAGGGSEGEGLAGQASSLWGGRASTGGKGQRAGAFPCPSPGWCKVPLAAHFSSLSLCGVEN